MMAPAPRRPTPKVSVCVVTYNQERYIRQCLESILAQQTDFDFEVIVGDDCSTDGTAGVIRELAQRHPTRLRAMLNPVNVGPIENYRAVHKAARGQFVAHVDGDDYVLPGKLAEQAALLDANPGYSAAFHRLRVVDMDDHATGRYWPTRAPAVLDCAYLVTHHPIIGHSSFMYRRGLLDRLLETEREFIDFRVYVELALQGRIGYLDACLGGYRVGIGVSQSNKWLGHILATLEHAAAHGVDPESVARGRANQLFRAARKALNLGDTEEFKRLIELSVLTRQIFQAQHVYHALRHYPGMIRVVEWIYRNVWNSRAILALGVKLRGHMPPR